MTARQLLLLLLPCGLFAEVQWRVENTNFTLSQASLVPTEERDYLYNYNRTRLRSDWKEDHFFVTGIGDVVNYLGEAYIDSVSFGYIKHVKLDTPFKTQTGFSYYDNGAVYAKLYRLYGGYDDATNRVVAGLQNITMGVGHIWTPTNLFNPRNTYALEPDETFGVAAISYTRYLGAKSQASVVVSQNENRSFKYAAEYKVSLESTDIILNTIKSDRTKMLGYAIEGDLGDTGIEVRSEGAFIETRLNTLTQEENEKKYFQGIVGADYAFVEGLSLTVEALYSSKIFSYAEILANIDTQLIANMAMSYFTWEPR